MTGPTLMDFMPFAPAKPAMGSTCNGCGQCCLASQCHLSLNLFGDIEEGFCPALKWNGEIYRCAVALDPTRYLAEHPHITYRSADLLCGGIANGCGCPDDVAEDLVALVLSEGRPVSAWNLTIWFRTWVRQTMHRALGMAQ